MTAVPAPARTATRLGDVTVGARAFASVDVYADLDSAAQAWDELAAVASMSGYQSRAFAAAYLDTLGAARQPFIVVARDARGAAIALLPMGRRVFGPLTLAEFLGDAWANYRMGLFRPGVHWSAQDVAALLVTAARARQSKVDTFLFFSQPEIWNDAPNPLAALPRQPSPSFARASRLPASAQDWIDAHFSKATQKKLRKKAKKLEAIGPVSVRRAGSAVEARQILTAYFAQRLARVKARGVADAGPDATALLQRLASFEHGPPELEMHALFAGERIVATFGGVLAGSRLSGIILSFEVDPAVAAASPGEQLVIEVARDAIARGLDCLDLGAGDARYKNECCEIEEPLFDSAIGITLKGRVAAQCVLAFGRLKRAIKQRPRIYAIAKRMQRRVGL